MATFELSQGRRNRLCDLDILLDNLELTVCSAHRDSNFFIFITFKTQAAVSVWCIISLSLETSYAKSILKKIFFVFFFVFFWLFSLREAMLP